MRKLLLITLGVCAVGAALKAEEESDGLFVILSPFLTALAIQVVIQSYRKPRERLA